MDNYYERLQDELDGIRPTKAGSNPEAPHRCRHGMLPEQCGICLRVGVARVVPKVPASKARCVKVTKPKRAKLLGIRTMAQFRKHMRDMGRDLVADGLDVEQCAGDVADCARYDADVMAFVRRKFPWAKTRLQVVELLADYIVG